MVAEGAGAAVGAEGAGPAEELAAGWAGASWGGGADPYTNQDAAFQWVDNISLIRGKHTFRMGADVRRDRYNYNGRDAVPHRSGAGRHLRSGWTGQFRVR